MAGHVFLTYSASDSTDPYLLAVVAQLTEAGLSVHAQQETNAHTLTPATRKLVDACGVLVPVILPSTASSERVRLEVEYARVLRKPVVALWVDGTLPPWLDGADIEDVTGRRWPAPEFFDSLRELAVAAAGPPGVPMTLSRRPPRPPGAARATPPATAAGLAPGDPTHSHLPETPPRPDAWTQILALGPAADLIGPPAAAPAAGPSPSVPHQGPPSMPPPPHPGHAHPVPPHPAPPHPAPPHPAPPHPAPPHPAPPHPAPPHPAPPYPAPSDLGLLNPGPPHSGQPHPGQPGGGRDARPESPRMAPTPARPAPARPTPAHPTPARPNVRPGRRRRLALVIGLVLGLLVLAAASAAVSYLIARSLGPAPAGTSIDLGGSAPEYPRR